MRQTNIVLHLSLIARIPGFLLLVSNEGVSLHNSGPEILYKTFFMLNPAEHEIYPSNNCCWHFNIYEQD